MSKWQECKLGEIAEKFAMGPFGSNIKAENFVLSGVPVIRGKNLNYYKYVDGDFVFLNEEKANQLKSSNCFPGDLVFTHRGTLGQVGLIPEGKYQRYVVSQSGMKLSVKQDMVDKHFLLYFFKSSIGQNELLQHEAQVGVPSLSNPLTSLKSVRISLPSLPEQRAIAGVLSSLDDKIDLLHQQNKTLEGMAEALFKHFFVDERKSVWQDCVVRELAAHEKRSINPKRNPETLFYHYSIAAFDLSRMPNHEPGSSILSNKYKVQRNNILFSKLNPDKDKRVWLIHGSINENSICSTEFQVLNPIADKYVFFLYGFISYPANYQEIAAGVGGTSGSHQRIDPVAIFESPCFVPDEITLADYNDMVVPIFGKIQRNLTAIQTLAHLRDTLLPKLMSGEVRVRDE